MHSWLFENAPVLYCLLGNKTRLVYVFLGLRKKSSLKNDSTVCAENKFVSILCWTFESCKLIRKNWLIAAWSNMKRNLHKLIITCFEINASIMNSLTDDETTDDFFFVPDSSGLKFSAIWDTCNPFSPNSFWSIIPIYLSPLLILLKV